MSGTSENALVLLAKAHDDYYALTHLAEDQAVSIWIIGFHAQQTVEKSIKAVLLSCGITYPFTHDLELLIKLLQKNGLSLPPKIENIPLLTAFGTVFRYGEEDEGPVSMDRDWMKAVSKEVIAWAESIIGLTQTNGLP